jgi:hypothetical protein
MTGCAMPYLPYETSSSPALVCSAHQERGRQRERIERSARAMRNRGSIMFQFLAMTQPGCRRSFPRHLLHRVIELAVSAVVVLAAQTTYLQPVNANQASRPNIVLIMADDK